MQNKDGSVKRLKTVEWVDDRLRMIDQTILPEKLVYLDIDNIKDVYFAIKELKVRGAPAIGIAAGFGLYIGVSDFPSDRTNTDFVAYVDKNCRYLASARPTAVNLFWALERVRRRAHAMSAEHNISSIKAAMLDEAKAILAEDRATCRAIGEHGFEVFKDFSSVLTHCNAGGLATSEYGTALAPIYVAAEKGKLIRVYSDETRPLLQGARITTFELSQAGIPVTLICDNMAPVVMRNGQIDAVIVGADRIARNGDVANKIGTYGVALAARAHEIPFYVAAPLSTFDPDCPSGEKIPIEERDPEEITFGFGRKTAPSGIDVYNPAFDVTPHQLITGIITEKGIIAPPNEERVADMLSLSQ